MSGIGSSPDLSQSRPSLPQAPANVGPTVLAGKAWLIAAGGGLLGILVLVTAIVMVFRGPSATEGAEGGATAVDEAGASAVATPNDQKIADAIAQIDKGNYGSGIEALNALGDSAAGRADVHRALFKAYSQTDHMQEAMVEIGLLMKTSPNIDLRAQENIALRQAVRDTALLEGFGSAPKAAVDEAWNLLKGGLGAVGLDDLYDIAYGQSGVDPRYSKARDHARREIAKADRTKMSPALAVTADLHVAGGACAQIKALLDRAAEKGDERTLVVLRNLVAPRIQGHWRNKFDTLGCIHEGSLTKAIGDLETRLRKK
jgi:hypothetical protein